MGLPHREHRRHQRGHARLWCLCPWQDGTPATHFSPLSKRKDLGSDRWPDEWKRVKEWISATQEIKRASRFFNLWRGVTIQIAGPGESPFFSWQQRKRKRKGILCSTQDQSPWTTRPRTHFSALWIIAFFHQEGRQVHFFSKKTEKQIPCQANGRSSPCPCRSLSFSSPDKPPTRPDPLTPLTPGKFFPSNKHILTNKKPFPLPRARYPLNQ